MRTNFLTRPAPARPLINAIGSDAAICGLGAMWGMMMNTSSPIVMLLIVGGGVLSMWPVDTDGQAKPWYANPRRMGGIGYMALGVLFWLMPRIMDWFFYRRFHEHLYEGPHFRQLETQMQWIPGALILLGAYFVFVSLRPRTKKDQTELTAGQS